jgi:hypothetical protein
MAMSALSNQPTKGRRKKSTSHVQEHRILPPKYQTADVLAELFEEGDGILSALQSTNDKPKFNQSCATAENSTTKVSNS